MTINRWFRAAPHTHGQVRSALVMAAAGEVPRLSLEEIHALHADFVWRSLQRLGVRPPDLEDALQEVFIVVHRQLEGFEHASRMTTWLFGICLRVASAQRRRAHVRHERTGATADWLDEVEETESHATETPEQAAVARELRTELEALLERLDPEKRATVVMFEIEGMSAPEIAALTDVPVGTVYSRLAAAREELRIAAQRARRRELALTSKDRR